MLTRAAATALAALALAGCGEPPRGSGVHVLTLKERIARDDAEFRAGEKLSLDELRQRLLSLELRPDELGRTIDEDYGIELVNLAIPPTRLSALDGSAIAGLQLDSNYRIAFADPATEHALAEEVAEEGFRRDKAQVIAELRRYGDWERIPRRRGLEPMPLFARRLESWCGYGPGEALRVIDGAWLEYAREYVDAAVRERIPGRKAAQFDCLRRVVYATELRRYFIGNRGRTVRPAS
jgi:hypothetical protein